MSNDDDEEEERLPRPDHTNPNVGPWCDLAEYNSLQNELDRAEFREDWNRCWHWERGSHHEMETWTQPYTKEQWEAYEKEEKGPWILNPLYDHANAGQKATMRWCFRVKWGNVTEKEQVEEGFQLPFDNDYRGVGRFRKTVREVSKQEKNPNKRRKIIANAKYDADVALNHNIEIWDLQARIVILEKKVSELEKKRK